MARCAFMKGRKRGERHFKHVLMGKVQHCCGAMKCGEELFAGGPQGGYVHLEGVKLVSRCQKAPGS